jgi:hypothetical protein
MLYKGLRSGIYPRMRYFDAIKNPDFLTEDLYGNIIAQKIIDKQQLLRVFYSSEGDVKIIINAYKTSKTEKYTP